MSVLTKAECAAVDDATPPVVEGTQWWEWCTLYRAIDRIVAERERAAAERAWDAGHELVCDCFRCGHANPYATR